MLTSMPFDGTSSQKGRVMALDEDDFLLAAF